MGVHGAGLSGNRAGQAADVGSIAVCRDVLPEQMGEDDLERGTGCVLQGGEPSVDLGGCAAEPVRDPWAANVSAICSISPTKRHAFGPFPKALSSACSGRSGIEVAHSPMRASSTPSTFARARTASSSAAVPLVHAAKQVFTAEAAPGAPSRTRTSRGDPCQRAATVLASVPARYMRVEPAVRTGGPMIPPSTKRSNSPAIERAVSGETAFTSTYRPSNAVAATASACSTAATGGQTETMTSAFVASSSRDETSCRPA